MRRNGVGRVSHGTLLLISKLSACIVRWFSGIFIQNLLSTSDIRDTLVIIDSTVVENHFQFARATILPFLFVALFTSSFKLPSTFFQLRLIRTQTPVTMCSSQFYTRATKSCLPCQHFSNRCQRTSNQSANFERIAMRAPSSRWE